MLTVTRCFESHKLIQFYEIFTQFLPVYSDPNPLKHAGLIIAVTISFPAWFKSNLVSYDCSRSQCFE